jgi:hypothetical protein
MPGTELEAGLEDRPRKKEREATRCVVNQKTQKKKDPLCAFCAFVVLSLFVFVGQV